MKDENAEVAGRVTAGGSSRDLEAGTATQRDSGQERELPPRPLNARQKLAVESRLAKPLAPRTVWARDAKYSEWSGRKALERGIATDDKIERYRAEQRAAGEPTDDDLIKLSKKEIVGRIKSGEATEALLLGTYKTASEQKATNGGSDDNRVTDIDSHNARRHVSVRERWAVSRFAARARELGFEAAVEAHHEYSASERARWPKLRGTDPTEPLEGRRFRA